MVMDSRSGRMAPSMMDSGREIKPMDMEHLFMLTVTSMKASGSMIRLTVMELINMPTVLLMSVNGTRTNNMAKELKNGQMVLNTKGITWTVKSMEKDN